MFVNEIAPPLLLLMTMFCVNDLDILITEYKLCVDLSGRKIYMHNSFLNPPLRK